jgi:hypothetical protein
VAERWKRWSSADAPGKLDLRGRRNAAGAPIIAPRRAIRGDDRDLAPPIYSAIYLGPSILAAEKGGLPLVFGMTIFAGLTEIAVGLMLDRLRLIFTQVVTGLTVFLVGLQLGVVGISEVLDVGHENLPVFHLQCFTLNTRTAQHRTHASLVNHETVGKAHNDTCTSGGIEACALPTLPTAANTKGFCVTVTGKSR